MNEPSKTVVFMGSPDFAVPSLEALHGSGRFSPGLVVSQPDRQRGRGRTFSPTPVRAAALDLGLNTQVMSKDNYLEIVEEIAALKPDIIVVTAFGVILKRDLLDIPVLGCVNVHASLLPRYRGVSPIQAAILAADKMTGCTTMQMDEGIDTGDILLMEETAIEPSDNAGTLTDRLARIGAHLLIRTLDGLVDQSIVAQPQLDDGTSYTRKIKKKHGQIDWTKEAHTVWLRVRAMTPWPSAFTFHGSKRLIIVEAVPADGSGEPGEVLSTDPLRIACGDGALEIKQLKPEGARAMAPSQYVAGHEILPGTRLG